MSLSYDVVLIAISVAVAVVGSHAGLAIMLQPGSAGGFRYKTRLISSAVAIGGSIWAMHFIGMLALPLPIAVGYSIFHTLASAFIAVILTGFALYAATSGRFGRWANEIGALLMGSGITSMHFIGIGAIRANCIVSYDLASSLLAFAVGAASAWLALRFVARGSRSAVEIFPAAVIMGLAISGMHYVAMAGTSFSLAPETGLILEPVLDQYYIACLAAVLAFLLCDLFIYLVLPEARSESPFSDGRSSRSAGRSWAAWRLFKARGNPSANSLAFEGADPGVFQAPLSGVELASELRHFESPQPTGAIPLASVLAADAQEAPTARDRIAIETPQGVYMVDPDEILFVAANGHYSTFGLFEKNGAGYSERFCSNSISVARKRLTDARFFQTHRSYIVNLTHARAVQKQGDGGKLALDCPNAPEISVSRSRIRELIKRLD